VDERLAYIRLIDEYQRNSFYPVTISALLALMGMPYFWFPWLG
jgi:hypothetical protein